MAPKTAIIYYSLYHHIATLAKEAKVGVEKAGGVADLFQVSETLPDPLLKQLKAPPKLDHPIADLNTLKNYDAFLFGVPTRYGNMPAQLKTFWDGTGSLWASKALVGKPAGVFVSTGQNGGQESTVMSLLSTFVHHGMIFVPLGYTHPDISTITEIHGGSPWGAGTFAGADGSRKPTKLELEIANFQGEHFYNQVSRLK